MIFFALILLRMFNKANRQGFKELIAPNDRIKCRSHWKEDIAFIVFHIELNANAAIANYLLACKREILVLTRYVC